MSVTPLPCCVCLLGESPGYPLLVWRPLVRLWRELPPGGRGRFLWPDQIDDVVAIDKMTPVGCDEIPYLGSCL